MRIRRNEDFHLWVMDRKRSCSRRQKKGSRGAGGRHGDGDPVSRSEDGHGWRRRASAVAQTAWKRVVVVLHGPFDCGEGKGRRQWLVTAEDAAASGWMEAATVVAEEGGEEEQEKSKTEQVKGIGKLSFFPQTCCHATYSST